MLPKVALSVFAFALSVTGAQAAVSTSGRCGKGFGGVTCAGSQFGNCCSSKSWCGSSSDHCGTGCNPAYGKCGSSPANPGTPATKPISRDALCGAQNKGQTCQGSAFGNCCSQHGYCGSGNPYCEASNCQKDYGSCNGSPAPSAPAGTTLTSVVAPSKPASTCSAVTVTLSAQTKTVTETSVVAPSKPASTCSAVTVTLSAETKTSVVATTVTELQSVVVTTVEKATETNAILTTITQTITEPTTVVDVTTITEPTTVVDFTTIIEPTTVVDITTITEPTTVVDITTITEPTTVVDITTITEPTTVVDITTITEPTTVVDITTITEPTTVVDVTTIPTTIISSTTIATTLVSTTTVSAAPVCSTQAVKEGGFDAGQGTVWDIAAGAEMYVSATQIAPSNTAVTINALASAPRVTFAWVTQAVALCQGTWRLSLSAKAGTSVGSIVLAGSLTTTAPRQFFPLGTLTQQFSRFDMDFVVPAGVTVGSLSVRVQFQDAVGARQAVLDYLTFTRQP